MDESLEVLTTELSTEYGFSTWQKAQPSNNSYFKASDIYTTEFNATLPLLTINWAFTDPAFGTD